MKRLYSLLFLTIAYFNSVAQEPIRKVLYHEFGKSELTQASQHEFEQVVQQIQQMDIRAVSVKSYADKVGTSEYNKQLSQQRSLLVVQMLQRVLSGQVSYDASYFGKDSLLTLNDWEQDKNRRTEISIWFNTPDKKVQVTNLVPYQEDVPEQRFEIDLDDTVTLTANEGTFIKFAPGSIATKKNEVATGKAQLLIREYYKPTDILLSGLQSMSDSGLLQTRGMLKVFIVQNGDTMKTETKLPVLLKMPANNNETASMNLFTTDHSDTSIWRDTKRSFTQVLSYWDFPGLYRKLQDFHFWGRSRVDTLQVGKSEIEEVYFKNSFKNSFKTLQTIYEFRGKKIIITKNRPIVKYYKCTATKKDTTTLEVKLFQKFKSRGAREFNLNTFDTSFVVKRVRSVYEIYTGGLAFINCDRFINAPKVTDFYVKTPGFDGAKILVYFKDINAFMTADYKDGSYQVKKVPAGEFVYLIAIGKKGNDLYYGKEPFTISKKGTAEVAMQKVKYEEMKKMFDVIGLNKTE
jgi:hypothetical protein